MKTKRFEAAKPFRKLAEDKQEKIRGVRRGR